MVTEIDINLSEAVKLADDCMLVKVSILQKRLTDEEAIRS